MSQIADLKKRSQLTGKFSGKYAIKISVEINRKVAQILKDLSKGNITRDRVQALINSQITPSLSKKVVDILIDTQKQGLYLTSNKVIKHFDAVLSGKKNVKIMPNLLVRKEHLKNYDRAKAIERLNKAMKEEISKLKTALTELRPNFEKDLKKRLMSGVDKISFDKAANKRILRELRAALTKQVKNYAKYRALDSAGQSLNNGESLGMVATNVQSVKQWISRFDDKVRNWHDKVNFQTKKTTGRFVVPYPGGTDYLSAPKVPPISPANFFNCRCVVFYKTIGKK